MHSAPRHPAHAPFDSKDSDLVLLSTDGVEFLVHKAIIMVVSPYLARLIPLACRPPPSTSRHRLRPTISLPFPAGIIDLFLHFVYPVPEPALDWTDCRALLDIAQHLLARSVIKRVSAHLLHPQHLYERPLPIYALASRAGLDSVARTAARRSLLSPMPPVDELARHLPGSSLGRLLDYRRAATKAARAVVSTRNGIPRWVQLQWRRLCFLSECPYGCADGPRRTLAWHRVASEKILVPVWWVEWMGAVRSALATRVDPAVARDERLLKIAVQRGARCSSCQSAVMWDLCEFSRIVGDVLEEAIASVCVDDHKREDGTSDDDSESTLVPSVKTNYLSSDKPVYPMYDYYFGVMTRRRIKTYDTGSAFRL
ncbi:uncharacterized protein BXZ73DRAFT_54488 [Epithele typhae]|uniref:uncharacterized protein n=1 Tax=Epithele typhae TaxID=378194 RepID=UPI002007301C|nr:uncharacterized protein BXZ73DRAFT_54488 [Epithele typhae]KAH9915184.1 hypothetical protein BXZ73DRAFT_54488 [Epithele typhae]